MLKAKGIVITGAGTAIICCLIGANYDTQSRRAVRLSATVTAPATATQPQEAQIAQIPLEEGLPDKSDVAASIAQFQSLTDEARDILRNLKNPDSFEQRSAWQNAYDRWVTGNQHLIKRCELWLGADGTETYSSLSLSCENLQLGGKWLQSSVTAGCLSQNSESKVYLAGSYLAIKKARAVLRGKPNPERRNGIIKTPKNIRALHRTSAPPIIQTGLD